MQSQLDHSDTSLTPIAAIRDPNYFFSIYQALRRISDDEADLARVVFESGASGTPRWTIIIPEELRGQASKELLEWVEARKSSFPQQTRLFNKNEIRIMLKFLREHIAICPELEKAEKMETILSNDKRPWESVDNASYFRKILGNMSDKGFGRNAESPGYVRFGLLGNGHSPNYQLEDTVGTAVACFHGLGSQKEAAISEEAFKTENLSDERFAYADIQQMIAKFG